MRSDLAMAALASAAVPGMKPVSVAGMRQMPADEDAGVQRALVEDATGRRWVVHAPLDAVAGARMQRNDDLVRALARHVPFKVPASVGHASVGRDGYAAVYPYVEGSPLDLARLPAGQGLASAVGRALAAVHNVPRAVFEEQDVPVFDAAGCRQRATAEVDRAAETGRVPTRLLARWEEAFDAPTLWQFATTPVHGSFGGGTVLVAFADETDAATGRVVALTDWGHAMVGDPAQDLTSIYSQASPEAWESVLDSYALARTHRPDPYLHARARLLAETRVLHGLAAAVADGAEEVERKVVEALRRMDRLTEDEDSLVPVTARPRAGAPSRSVAAARVTADPSAETALERAREEDVSGAAGPAGPVRDAGRSADDAEDEPTEQVPVVAHGRLPGDDAYDEASDPDGATGPDGAPDLDEAADADTADADRETSEAASLTAPSPVAAPSPDEGDLTVEVALPPSPADQPVGEPLHADSEERIEEQAAEQAAEQSGRPEPPASGGDLDDPADRLSELYGMPDLEMTSSTAEDPAASEPVDGTSRDVDGSQEPRASGTQGPDTSDDKDSGTSAG
ncbi:phosphotransferase [Ornithinimicrobium tianjinense]|nr:phosphotransferase [Ornithinimicrobium tianjinense]